MTWVIILVGWAERQKRKHADPKRTLRPRLPPLPTASSSSRVLLPVPYTRARVRSTVPPPQSSTRTTSSADRRALVGRAVLVLPLFWDAAGGLLAPSAPRRRMPASLSSSPAGDAPGAGRSFCSAVTASTAASGSRVRRRDSGMLDVPMPGGQTLVGKHVGTAGSGLHCCVCSSASHCYCVKLQGLGAAACPPLLPVPSAASRTLLLSASVHMAGSVTHHRTASLRTDTPWRRRSRSAYLGQGGGAHGYAADAP